MLVHAWLRTTRRGSLTMEDHIVSSSRVIGTRAAPQHGSHARENAWSGNRSRRHIVSSPHDAPPQVRCRRFGSPIGSNTGPDRVADRYWRHFGYNACCAPNQGAGHEHSTVGFHSAQTSRTDAEGSALGADGFGSASSLRANAASGPTEDRLESRHRASATACSSTRGGSTGAAFRPCAGSVEAGGRRRRGWRPVRVAQEAVRRLTEHRGRSFGAGGTSDTASSQF